MMPFKENVGVIGATSIIGDYLLPLLAEQGYSVMAFSRRKKQVAKSGNSSIAWQLLANSASAELNVHQKENQIHYWISLAPITALPEYFPMLLAYGIRHIVAVSSTSRFTKGDSPDPYEKKLAKDLAAGEDRLIAWAQNKEISYTIIRPTLIYSMGRDKNISVIASFIRRFSFFCILGEATGLRQPVHAGDVAYACSATLNAKAAVNRCYNISGGEVITYQEMVRRIFLALDKNPQFIKFPLWLFSFAVLILKIFPHFRQWSTAMAQRMNKDMVFDHAEASRDLNFSPRPFDLTGYDMQSLDKKF